MLLYKGRGAHELDEITTFLKNFIEHLNERIGARFKGKGKRGCILKFYPDDRTMEYLEGDDAIIENNVKYLVSCSIFRTPLRKSEVVEWSLKGKLYPKKSTRHIVKTCRALYINIPFAILKGKGMTEEDADRALEMSIKNPRHIHRLYAEPVYIYDELMYELRKRK